jgi:hypothetical protein
MAMKVEVTVASIVRSFATGVIGERIAVRKLEKLVEFQYQLGYVKGVAAEKYMRDAPQEHVGGAPGQLNRFPDETIKIIEKNDDVYET